MELINLSNVNYTYVNGNTALKNINMNINPQERIAILGPNGAGKSTLFQLFNGLLTPTSGNITVDGMTVCKENLSKIRQNVGMVFQDSDDQLFNSNVRQEIAYGPMNMGIKGKELDELIKWALNSTKISEYENRSPNTLSGGEKKRVALASVLAMKPKVLVLDEPTAALDPIGVSQLIKLLNSINKDLKITIIFSTHDVDIVPLLADRIFVLNKGEIVLHGSTKEVFSNVDILRKINLRLPRVAHLTEILIKDGFIKSNNLPLTIGQARELFKKNTIK
ncbi:energy-coupling factor ABC transporter ATP-binding protein [Clostridium tyrobutyricum]|jgi:cobalt/nickel transport system ATP-binding protein|uniref:energy-coupling factor ABC transporter ATP-binding protein n=1 Tax=Clostridium tyrobutyricum TaxID=1519 RepID=UPI00057CE9DB|nr:ATP-binding cassette domain-containing protein [Clostridium tyrobutyricum]MBV4426212.1 ATP-binding cassette domain-containing protein [Clostridium tyrobutyricum]MBV4428998.1 ATP-binding cassette domain-containing protein [Clostridium tyrobutyricum]MBV4431743.1 ATP-binding cassette domain-containing protein [Clostridium tyrobutyricum]MBV4438370.1 ATP-binding cassette domain-containing protein [Clostridium tyrobutyricum]MBV4440818.1 ATP-binding cassette domain-containing protein [Clostridium 